MALPTRRLPSIQEASLSQENNTKEVIRDLPSASSLEESERIEQPIEKRPIPTAPLKEYGTDDEPFIDRPEDLPKKQKSKYIDKKKKKIVPLGGKKAIAKDYDDRRNKATALKIFRFFLYLFILVLFLFGLKNTFFPKEALSNDEIAQIATTAVGETGFPTEKGKAFVESFMAHYLKLDNADLTNQQLLKTFYGEQQLGNNSTVATFNSTNKQSVIGMPIVYESTPLSPDSASYKVTALVTDENGNTNTNEGATATAHWVSFSVNVYHNPKTGTLTIHPNSPTIIPNIESADSVDLPSSQKIGTGDSASEMEEKLLPTITGFLKAYALSDSKNHSQVLQYVPNNPDKELIAGFGGSVVMAGDENNAISELNIYKTNNSNEWKVDLEVVWKDAKATNNENAASYTSRYIITIQETNDNKYIVTKFAPFLYLPETEQS